MNIPSNLLPEGFRDRLPPKAEDAARVSRAMIDVLVSNGYARVAPAMAVTAPTGRPRFSSTGPCSICN